MQYEFLPILKEGEFSISGEELLRRAKEMNAEGTKEDCDYFLAHPEELEGMKDYYIVFTDYTKHGRFGVLYVSYLDIDGGQWCLIFGRHGDNWCKRVRLPRKVSESLVAGTLDTPSIVWSVDISNLSKALDTLTEAIEGVRKIIK